MKVTIQPYSRGFPIDGILSGLQSRGEIQLVQVSGWELNDDLPWSYEFHAVPKSPKISKTNVSMVVAGHRSDYVWDEEYDNANPDDYWENHAAVMVDLGWNHPEARLDERPNSEYWKTQIREKTGLRSVWGFGQPLVVRALLEAMQN